MQQGSEYTLYLFYISYFSGKMQAYLRYKEIPHREVEPKWRALTTLILPNTGLMKVPVVRTPEGQWLADSTPMIDWFEQKFPRAVVIPEDPLQAFFSRLVEDYADEWMWRPALHYRWSYATDSHALSRRFAETFLSDQPLMTKGMTAALVRRRQRQIYVEGDGITPDTRVHVEGIYLGTVDRLQAIFERQDFLLGARPSLADFGFFASMFRHFSSDPTPSVIMQTRAPAVLEWVGRLWNARGSRIQGSWLPAGSLPEGWTPILRDAAEAYLPYLHANAVAWRERRKAFDVDIQGTLYRNLPAVQYRVWCRQRLQQHYAAVPANDRAAVDGLLHDTGCFEPLMRDGEIPSGLYSDVTPPLCVPRAVSPIGKLRHFVTGTHWHAPKLRVRPPGSA